MKVIFLAYRSWAINASVALAKRFPENSYKFIHTDEDFKKFISLSGEDLGFDIVIAIGWSWILPDAIVDRTLCLGLHPSDLPKYRGGSPIQNQIIDGILDSKMSLFELKSGIDSGPIWRQSDLSLRGDSMAEIFDNLEKSTIHVVTMFFEDFPDIEPKIQNLDDGSFYWRRNSEDSKLEKIDFNFENLIPLYNKIRCLTAPYPNAFIEDAQGNRIYFEKIKFFLGSND
jgi:methionyl-tRNA formyltransferase